MGGGGGNETKVQSIREVFTTRCILFVVTL